MRSLKELREERGLTQGELAASLGFNGKVTISHFESGRRRIPEAILRPLARRLRVKPAELRSWSRFAHLVYLLKSESYIEEEGRGHDADYLIDTREGRNYLARVFKLVMEIIDSGEALELDVDLHEAVLDAANEIVRQEGHELS